MRGLGGDVDGWNGRLPAGKLDAQCSCRVIRLNLRAKVLSVDGVVGLLLIRVVELLEEHIECGVVGLRDLDTDQDFAEICSGVN